MVEIGLLPNKYAYCCLFGRDLSFSGPLFSLAHIYYLINKWTNFEHTAHSSFHFDVPKIYLKSDFKEHNIHTQRSAIAFDTIIRSRKKGSAQINHLFVWKSYFLCVTCTHKSMHSKVWVSVSMYACVITFHFTLFLLDLNERWMSDENTIYLSNLNHAYSLYLSASPPFSFPISICCLPDSLLCKPNITILLNRKFHRISWKTKKSNNRNENGEQEEMRLGRVLLMLNIHTNFACFRSPSHKLFVYYIEFAGRLTKASLVLLSLSLACSLLCPFCFSESSKPSLGTCKAAAETAPTV